MHSAIASKIKLIIPVLIVCYYFSQSALADISHNDSKQAGQNGEPLVNEEKIDWGEYSRIDQGELTVALSLNSNSKCDLAPIFLEQQVLSPHQSYE